jgi:hypothetical protein
MSVYNVDRPEERFWITVRITLGQSRYAQASSSYDMRKSTRKTNLPCQRIGRRRNAHYVCI